MSWFQRGRSKRSQWGLEGRQLDRKQRALALLKGVPPIACQTEEERQQRTRFEKVMSAWSPDQWHAYDQPWLTLLEETLQDTGLSDKLRKEELNTLANHYQRAHWPGRHVPSRPLDLPLAEAVWNHLQKSEGLGLPEMVWRMASTASKTFSERVWTWGMHAPTIAPLQKVLQAFRSSVPSEVVLKAWLDAPSDRLNFLWLAWGDREREVLLKAWLKDPTDRVNAPLARLAELEQQRARERYSPLSGYAWLTAFIESMQESLVNGAEEPASLVCQRLAQLKIPMNHQTLKQAWEKAFLETLETFPEQRVLASLDGMTESLEHVLPLREWVAQEQWNDGSGIPLIQRLPETQARWQAQARAMERERALSDLSLSPPETAPPHASSSIEPRRVRLRS